MIGQTISHYTITEKLGEGGMGVVYKAEDTKLERTVALKFLASHLMANEEAGKRFIREAKAAAALDHPNICTVHEIDEVDDHTFIAMAYLEGETLDKRIAAGPVPLDDALDIALQIARGLEAAHRKSIFHRDIKPANVMLLDQGSERLIKIMDFGLAQLAERSRLTDLDTTLGTMAYMSPEQTEGAGTDQRTDLWALGCVMYEMISGQLPFRGDYNQAVQYSILHEAPDPLTGLRTGVPMELEWIVDKCLAKNREERYPEASALILDVSTLRKKLEAGRSTVARADRPPLPSEMGTRAAASFVSQQAATPSLQAASAPAPAQVPAPATQVEATADPGHPLVKYHVIENLDSGGDSVVYRAEDTQLKRSVTINVVPESAAREAVQRQRTKDRALVAAVVLFLAALAGMVALWLRTPAAEPAPLRRFAYATPEDFVPGDSFMLPAAISPNGKHIAVAGGNANLRLRIQDLDQQQPREIEGTEGARSPFWSPGSDFIGFGAGNELKKVSVQGGLSVRLCELPGEEYFGGAWRPDGEMIVFGSGPPYMLYQVPARGGEPELLISAEEESESSSEGPTGGLAAPHFLPHEAGPRMLIFTFGTVSERTMMLQDLDSGRRETLRPGHQPFYSGGHIVYQLGPIDQDLWALPFSLETLTPTGEPFPFVQAARSPTAAADGTLVYFDRIRAVEQLTWFDRQGTRIGEVGQGQVFPRDLSLSPDGRRVAVSARENGNQDIWVHDMERGVKTRVTTDSSTEYRAIWSPDGEEIAFVHTRSTGTFRRRADGGGEERKLIETAADPGWISDWSVDGKYILYSISERGFDLWYGERNQDGDYEPHLFLQTPFSERTPKLSPDGRFIVYTSDASGRDEIYVQPFPEGGRRTTVSSNGGQNPRWSRDGRELFYTEGSTLVAVAVAPGPTFSARSKEYLFEHPMFAWPYMPQYDVSPDGKRFIIPTPVEADPDAKPMIRVVQNWVEEFREHKPD